MCASMCACIHARIYTCCMSVHAHLGEVMYVWVCVCVCGGGGVCVCVQLFIFGHITNYAQFSTLTENRHKMNVRPTHSDVQRPVIFLGCLTQFADRVSQVRGEGAVDMRFQLKQKTMMIMHQCNLPTWLTWFESMIHPSFTGSANCWAAWAGSVASCFFILLFMSFHCCWGFWCRGGVAFNF